MLFHHVCRRVNENCKQAREVIGLAMQQEKASLRCNRHSNLVSDFQPATTFETLIDQKHLDMTEKFGLISSRKPNKKRNVAPDYLQPVFRKRPRPKPISMSSFQQPKDHGRI